MAVRIRRPLAVGVSAVLAITLGPAGAAESPQASSERTIYVSVMDGGTGAPVTDLAQADFTIREDNTIREIVSIKQATEPVFYVVLVDTTPAANTAVQYFRDALTAFAKSVLGASPQSQIALGEFGGAGMITRAFTSNLQDIEAAIPKLLPKPSEPVLNEALVEVAKQLAKVPSPRRVIVTINMEPTSEASRLEAKLVAEQVRKSGATVWAISVQTGTRRDANRDQMLTGLANNTGGLRVTLQTPVPLPQFLLSIAANSMTQYAVTIRRPSGGAPAKSTSVAVNRQGARALTLMWSDK